MLRLDGSVGNNWNGPVYAINNKYEGTDATKINHLGDQVPVKFAVCRGTQDWDMTPESMRQEVIGQVCELGNEINPTGASTTEPSVNGWVNMLEWLKDLGGDLKAGLVG